MKNDPCQEKMQNRFNDASCVIFVTTKNAKTLVMCDF
jgi:hypothetical protein